MYGSVRANDGYRARIGVIIPSVNTVVEAWMPKVVPEGVTVHTGRMPISTDTSVEALAAMSEHEVQAATRLADCEPDLIMYSCTASTVVSGRAHDLALMAKLSDVTQVPCYTTTDAIVRALAAVNARRIAIVSPYPKQIDDLERAFFEDCGLEVFDTRSFGIADNRELADPSPGEVYRLARSAITGSVDALLISCLAMRSHYIAGQLEQDLGIPVITSATATLWAALRAAGVWDAIHGYGSLLELQTPRPRVRASRAEAV